LPRWTFAPKTFDSIAEVQNLLIILSRKKGYKIFKKKSNLLIYFYKDLFFIWHLKKIVDFLLNLAPTFVLCSQGLLRYRGIKCVRDFWDTLYNRFPHANEEGIFTSCHVFDTWSSGYQPFPPFSPSSALLNFGKFYEYLLYIAY
jgi:hypothetical protein